MGRFTSEDKDWIGEDFVVIDHCNIEEKIEIFAKQQGKKKYLKIKIEGLNNLKEICTNPNVKNINIQKKLEGYPKDWYECRIFNQTYGSNIRLIYYKCKHKKDKNINVVNILDIYNHKDVRHGNPKNKKGNIKIENLDYPIYFEEEENNNIEEDLTQEDIKIILKFLQ